MIMRGLGCAEIMKQLFHDHEKNKYKNGSTHVLYSRVYVVSVFHIFLFLTCHQIKQACIYDSCRVITRMYFFDMKNSFSSYINIF